MSHYKHKLFKTLYRITENLEAHAEVYSNDLGIWLVSPYLNRTIKHNSMYLPE